MKKEYFSPSSWLEIALSICTPWAWRVLSCGLWHWDPPAVSKLGQRHSQLRQGRKLVFPSWLQCPALGFPLLFQNNPMGQLTLQTIYPNLVVFTQEGENLFHVWQRLVLQGCFPQLLPCDASRDCLRGMPSLQVMRCELAEGLGREGSCSLFLTRMHRKRTTCADSTISLGMWCALATSHRELFTNNNLSF